MAKTTGNPECGNIIMDGYEWICLDTGEVLNPHQVPHLEIYPSGPLDYRKGLIDTYMVPRNEDERFLRLVRAQTRVKYGESIDKALKEFDRIAELVKSQFNIPLRVIDAARKEYRELMLEKKILTEKRVKRYAIVMLYYWIRREGIPISFRDYVKLFSEEERRRFTEIYGEIMRRYGDAARAISMDYKAFLLKGLSVIRLDSSREIVERAEEIAEKIGQSRAVKPNVLALVSIILACEERGIKIPKTRIARILGAVNYHDTLKYARNLISRPK